MLDSGDSSDTIDTGDTLDTLDTGDTTSADTTGTTSTPPDTTPAAHGGLESAGTSMDTASSVDTGTHSGKSGTEGISTLDTKGADLNAIVNAESFEALATQAKNNAVEHAKNNSNAERQAELNVIRDTPNNARLADNRNSNALGGHSMDTGAIVCRNGLTNAQAAHVAQHEFTHKTSFQGSRVTETESSTINERVSGIHVLVRETSKATGETTVKADSNRSLNEGFTERETLSTEVETYGKVTDCGLKCYTQNMDYASQLESLVGRETVTDAYYNGNLEALSSAVNQLAKDETAWTNLTEKLDTLCVSTEGKTPEELAAIENAKIELDTLMARMAENKAQIEAAKQNGGKS